jgi:hypothetical protein
MDFIEALPKVGGKSVILTVVDRLSKYAHFVALAHPYIFSNDSGSKFLCQNCQIAWTIPPNCQ